MNREAAKGRRWLRQVAEAIIAIVWLVTIVSVLAGHWPGLTRWLVLLSSTVMAVSSRLVATHPMVSRSMLLVAAVLAVAGAFVSRQ
jgi:hypothetical protein